MPRSARGRSAASVDSPIAIHLSLNSAIRAVCSSVSSASLVLDIANPLRLVGPLDPHAVSPARQLDWGMLLMKQFHPPVALEQAVRDKATTKTRHHRE